MNVVLDDAEEVWTKDTKSRKVGDRQSLGAVFFFSILDPLFVLPSLALLLQDLVARNADFRI